VDKARTLLLAPTDELKVVMEQGKGLFVELPPSIKEV
jgi:hypothetical protein